ncbi:hypothetical protein Tco_0701586 [Tanacetum coccineum]
MEDICEFIHNKVLEFTVSTTNDLIKETLPKMVTDVVNKERESSQVVIPALISHEFSLHAPKIIEELFRIHMPNAILNVHPTTSASTATTTTSDLQKQLYLKMKSDHQAQVAYPELWDGLKAKFEKSLASSDPGRTDAFRKHDHDDHQGDDANPEGEKNMKRQKMMKSSKSISGSSSKQPTKKSASKQ